jgi:hypothetical protein
VFGAADGEICLRQIPDDLRRIRDKRSCLAEILYRLITAPQAVQNRPRVVYRLAIVRGVSQIQLEAFKGLFMPARFGQNKTLLIVIANCSFYAQMSSTTNQLSLNGHFDTLQPIKVMQTACPQAYPCPG